MNWFPIHLHTLPNAFVAADFCGVVISVEINTSKLQYYYNPSQQWMRMWPAAEPDRLTYFIHNWNGICPQKLSEVRIVFSIENLPCNSTLNLLQLRDSGLSSIQIFHPQSPNLYIDPITGLSGHGHALLKFIADNNILLDLSHLSGNLLSHVLDHALGPKIVSHVVCSDLLQPSIVARANAMTPDELLACDAKLYGLPFIDDLLSPIGTPDPLHRKTDVALLAQHIKRMTEIVGIDRVALGPDFFSESDYKKLGVNTVSGLDAPLGLINLQQCLLREGFSEHNIDSVFFKNAVRVMGEF